MVSIERMPTISLGKTAVVSLTKSPLIQHKQSRVQKTKKVGEKRKENIPQKTSQGKPFVPKYEPIGTRNSIGKLSVTPPSTPKKTINRRKTIDTANPSKKVSLPPSTSNEQTTTQTENATKIQNKDTEKVVTIVPTVQKAQHPRSAAVPFPIYPLRLIHPEDMEVAAAHSRIPREFTYLSTNSRPTYEDLQNTIKEMEARINECENAIEIYQECIENLTTQNNQKIQAYAEREIRLKAQIETMQRHENATFYNCRSNNDRTSSYEEMTILGL